MTLATDIVPWQEALALPDTAHGLPATGGLDVAMAYAECVDLTSEAPIPELVLSQTDASA